MANDGIYIKIDGDSADYQKALSDATKSTEKFDKKASESLDGLKKKFDQASGGVGGFGTKAEQAGGKMKRFNGIVGQAGFQIQDFAVQLQSGTSAFVAFGQQGSQLAGAFGPGGAVIGAIIAVGAALGGVLVNSLNAAEVEVETFTKSISDLVEQMNELEKAQLEKLIGGTGGLKDQIAQLEKFDETIAVTKSRIETLEMTLSRGFGSTKDIEKWNKELTDLRGTLVDNEKGYEKLTEQLEQAQQRLAILNGEQEETTERTKEETDAILSLIESLRIQNETYGYSEAALTSYVAKLKGATPEELKMIEALAQSIEKKKLDAEAQEKLNKQLEKSNQLRQRWVEIEAENERSRARQAEGLINQLLTTEEMAAKIREERLEALKAFNTKELEELGGHAEAKRRIEEDYQKAITVVQKAEYGSRSQLLGQAFGNISSLMNTENKKLFEIGKAAAIAQATISGYEAAVYSYKWGAQIGGPIGGAAAAAASLVATGVQIANIASTQFGSKSAPSANTGGGSSSAAAVAPITQQSYNITLQSDTGYVSTQSVADLFNTINQGLNDGFEFNVQVG